MERKTIRFEVKAVGEEDGIIEGYGATFSNKPDSYGDIIDPGAFTKTLKENAENIVSLFNHYINEPIGLPELKQDKNGLFARIKLVMEVQKARDVMALTRAGVIKHMSIGYDTIKSEFVDGIRHLKEVKLYDVSPVIFAANPEAVILSVKDIEGMPDSVLDALGNAITERQKVKGEDVTEMELKPYPNEHACRLRSPDDFQKDSFKRTSRVSDGKKYSIIMGKLKDEDAMTEQAYRYDKEVWDATDAKAHCKEHDGTFEAAAKDEGKSGRVLSATNISKVRSALNALQALLDTAETENEPEKSTHEAEALKEAEILEEQIERIKSMNEGFNVKEAESKIDAILEKLRK